MNKTALISHRKAHTGGTSNTPITDGATTAPNTGTNPTKTNNEDLNDAVSTEVGSLPSPAHCYLLFMIFIEFVLVHYIYVGLEKFKF